jgi:anti-sigma factor ChrR (cupin superfamily)
MTEPTPNTCSEQDALVSYLYGELEPSARARYDEHLAACAECRVALEGMREVRAQLATWQLPEEAGAGAGGSWLDVGGLEPGRTGRSARPWWAPGALAAAAVLLLAVGAGIANLEIRYGRDGVSIRTGWSRPPAGGQTTAAAAPSQLSEARSVQTVSSEDLAALEKRLRTEFRALAATSPAPARAASASVATQGSASSNAQVLERVQALIDQSEARQRRELAYRVAQVVRDFDTQRQTDLVRIQQGLGQIEGSTAADRQLLNYLVRVSQRQK